jgi:hypothetical protein
VIIFLRRLQSRVAKKSHRKNLITNYFILKKLLYNFKFYNKLYLYRHFFQIKKSPFFLNPTYKFSKQFFTQKTFFEDFLKENQLKGFFLNKSISNKFEFLRSANPYSYEHIYGYNYYLYNFDIKKHKQIKFENENTENLLKLK